MSEVHQHDSISSTSLVPRPHKASGTATICNSRCNEYPLPTVLCNVCFNAGITWVVHNPLVRAAFIVILICTLSAIPVFHGKSDLGYWFNLHHSKTLPYAASNFVGRNDEMDDLLLDMSNQEIRIFSIVGSPGFGKSTLAIQGGHHLVRKGFTVHYVNMVEVSDVEALPKKLLDGAEIQTKNATTDRLLKWSRNLPSPTVIIFDNCDNILHKQKNELQGITKKLLWSSAKLKIVMTSRQRTMQLANFRSFRLHELSREASCTLLQNVVKDLDSTLCEPMTNLTGNVPLALLVVGSLLNLPDPPTPNTLIKNLKNRLMATLSPEDLPDDDRVNSSIALSYQYLNRRVQKVGRYLASFPGSFDKKAACEILLYISRKMDSGNCDKVDVHLDVLMQRSLLEYSRRTDRYQFHRLIREFFIGVQKSIGENGLKESKRFAIAFQLYYSKMLGSLANQFSHDYPNALHTLDTERHNIEKLLLNFVTNHTVSLPTAIAVESALRVRLLQCRFSAEDLVNPIQQIISYLDNYFKPISRRIPLHVYAELYVNLITNLARLESGTVGTEKVLIRLEKRRHWIESLYSQISGTSYTAFFLTLADYNAILGRHGAVRECYVKILKKKLTGCTVGDSRMCDFQSIEMVLNRLENYKQRNFLKLFFDDAQLEPILVASYLITLQKAYESLNDDDSANEATIKLIDLFPQLMDAEFNILDHYTIEKIISLFVQIGKVDEAYNLKEKLLNEALGYQNQSFHRAIQLAEFLFNNKEYQKAAKKAKSALARQLPTMIIKTFSNNTLFRVLKIIGICEYYNGNRSESLKYLGQLVDFVYENYTSANAEELEMVHHACFYITIQGHTACVKIILTDIIHLILVGAVDWNTDSTMSNEQWETQKPVKSVKPDEPLKANEVLQSLSAHSKAIASRDQYGLIMYHLSNVLWKHLFERSFSWLSLILDSMLTAIWAINHFINSLFNVLLSTVYVRYAINILWIFSKVCWVLVVATGTILSCYRIIIFCMCYNVEVLH